MLRARDRYGERREIANARAQLKVVGTGVNVFLPTCAPRMFRVGDSLFSARETSARLRVTATVDHDDAQIGALCEALSRLATN